MAEEIKNIERDTTKSLWELYKNCPPTDRPKAIFDSAKYSFTAKRTWYWANIAKKKINSTYSRIAALIFLGAGTILQIMANTVGSSDNRLTASQLGLAAFGVAGLLQLSDKAFGWSTGWMRYISTVLSMETAYLNFEFEWARTTITTNNPAADENIQKYINLAENLEETLTRLQADETKNWIAEFNSSIGIIDTAIKSQREEIQHQFNTLKAEVENSKKNQKPTNPDTPGSINISITFTENNRSFSIYLDDNETILNTKSKAISLNNIKPGIHKIKLLSSDEHPVEASTSVEVEPNKITNINFNNPF